MGYKRYKLTMVSVWYRGVRHVRFIDLPVDEKGTAKLPRETLESITSEIGIPEGSAFGIGC